MTKGPMTYTEAMEYLGMNGRADNRVSRKSGEEF